MCRFRVISPSRNAPRWQVRPFHSSISTCRPSGHYDTCLQRSGWRVYYTPSTCHSCASGQRAYPGYVEICYPCSKQSFTQNAYHYGNMTWGAQNHSFVSLGGENLPIGTKCSNKLKYETNIGIDRKLILRTDESLRDTQSRSGFFLHDARRIRAEIGQLRFQRVHHRWWSAQVEVLVEIAYLRFQEIFGDKTVCMAGDIFFGKNINEVSSQEAVKFF